MSTTHNSESHAREENRDPISGAPGAHPIGTGVGAALGGAAAGAAAGTVAGPVGMLVGVAVGAIVGGLAGKGIAETISPTPEWERARLAAHGAWVRFRQEPLSSGSRTGPYQ